METNEKTVSHQEAEKTVRPDKDGDVFLSEKGVHKITIYLDEDGSVQLEHENMTNNAEIVALLHLSLQKVSNQLLANY